MGIASHRQPTQGCCPAEPSCRQCRPPPSRRRRGGTPPLDRLIVYFVFQEKRVGTFLHSGSAAAVRTTPWPPRPHRPLLNTPRGAPPGTRRTAQRRGSARLCGWSATARSAVPLCRASPARAEQREPGERWEWGEKRQRRERGEWGEKRQRRERGEWEEPRPRATQPAGACGTTLLAGKPRLGGETSAGWGSGVPQAAPKLRPSPPTQLIPPTQLGSCHQAQKMFWTSLRRCTTALKSGVPIAPAGWEKSAGWGGPGVFLFICSRRDPNVAQTCVAAKKDARRPPPPKDARRHAAATCILLQNAATCILFKKDARHFLGRRASLFTMCILFFDVHPFSRDPCPTLVCPALHCTALHCTALHCTALHCTALHCTALPCPALIIFRPALPCPALHCTDHFSPCPALPCPALHCTALPCMRSALCALCSVPCVLCPVPSAQRQAPSAQRPALCALCSVLSTQRSVLSAQRSALSAQRSALCAQRPALCALRSALCAQQHRVPVLH
eukprot:gene6765-biopygen7431